MEINRSNTSVQRFTDVSTLQRLDKINELYNVLPLDMNLLMNILLPVASEVILCPANGSWRCVATVGARENQVAIFFPWIFPKTATGTANPPKKLAIGISGDVELEEISQFCNEITMVLEENTPK